MHSPVNVTRLFAMAENPIDGEPVEEDAGAKADAYRRKARAHEREAALCRNPEMRAVQLRLAG
jgi:hypothetical protein